MQDGRGEKRNERKSNKEGKERKKTNMEKLKRTRDRCMKRERGKIN